MRHRVSGKQLSRTTSHRKALLRNLAASLVEHEAIRTTEAKAKQVQRFVERLITIARGGTLHARRRVISIMGDRHMTDEDGGVAAKTVVGKLLDDVAPRYVDRPGGYTRIIHLSDRRIGDSGKEVLLQLVEAKPAGAEEAPQSISRRKRRASKRREAAVAMTESPPSQDQSQDASPQDSETEAPPEARDEQPDEHGDTAADDQSEPPVDAEKQ